MRTKLQQCGELCGRGRFVLRQSRLMDQITFSSASENGHAITRYPVR